MKTADEIALEFMDIHFSGGGPERFRKFKFDLITAFQKVVQQERERTCEWVQDDIDCFDAFDTGCGNFYSFEPGRRTAEFIGCPYCLRKISVKPPSTDSNEMGREG